MTSPSTSEQVRALNDAFRTVGSISGDWIISPRTMILSVSTISARLSWPAKSCFGSWITTIQTFNSDRMTRPTPPSHGGC